MIQIITDSSTLYTPEEGRKIGVESIPLCVSIGDNHYRDLQVDMGIFYEQIRKGGIPTSSQPPIGDVVEAYKASKGKRIINISMADGLSGTYQTACSAKGMVDNAQDITVVNTRSLCGPHRYMVEKAQKMVEEGASAEDILAYLDYAIAHTESFLIPQDFAFLKRGGRLTRVAATLGALLHIKPIMTLTDDGTRLDKFGVGRTMAVAARSIINHLKKHELGEKHILYISHADALKDAQKMKEMFEQSFDKLEVIMLELSPAFVTQGGPQCVAIQYIER